MDFFVSGVPRAKQSFRAITRKDGRRGGYTDPAIKAWEDTVAIKAKEAMEGKPPYRCRVTVILDFYLKGDIADLDNLTKAVLDGIQKIIYDNDRKVHRLSVEKHIEPDARTGVSIEVIPY